MGCRVVRVSISAPTTRCSIQSSARSHLRQAGRRLKHLQRKKGAAVRARFPAGGRTNGPQPTAHSTLRVPCLSIAVWRVVAR
eukprot:scaffold15141_cov101-Isochrysis_galbana.AAC.2